MHTPKICLVPLNPSRQPYKSWVCCLLAWNLSIWRFLVIAAEADLWRSSDTSASPHNTFGFSSLCLRWALVTCSAHRAKLWRLSYSGSVSWLSTPTEQRHWLTTLHFLISKKSDTKYLKSSLLKQFSSTILCECTWSNNSSLSCESKVSWIFDKHGEVVTIDFVLQVRLLIFPVPNPSVPLRKQQPVQPLLENTKHLLEDQEVVNPWSYPRHQVAYSKVRPDLHQRWVF